MNKITKKIKSFTEKLFHHPKAKKEEKNNKADMLAREILNIIVRNKRVYKIKTNPISPKNKTAQKASDIAKKNIYLN